MIAPSVPQIGQTLPGIGTAVAYTEAISDGCLPRPGLTDPGWLRGVAILIPEIRGDLVGRIRIEYIGGLPDRCWMLMVAFSFAASVAPTGVSKRILLAQRRCQHRVSDRRAEEPRTKCVRCSVANWRQSCTARLLGHPDDAVAELTRLERESKKQQYHQRRNRQARKVPHEDPNQATSRAGY